MTRDERSIKFRDVSCFCGTLLGQCDCFSSRIHHIVQSQIQTRPEIKHKKSNISLPSRKNSSTPPTNITQPPVKTPKLECFVPSTSKQNLRSARQDFEMTNIDSKPPIPYLQAMEDHSLEIECFGALDFESVDELLNDSINVATLPVTWTPNGSDSVKVKSVASNASFKSANNIKKSLHKIYRRTNNTCFLECHKCNIFPKIEQSLFCFRKKS